MDSISLSEDLSTSTPIQKHNDGRLNGGFKRFYSSPEKDLLSPIKASSRFNLCEFLEDSVNLDVSNTETLKLNNKLLAGVTRKLRFVEKAKLLDVSDGHHNDSGITSDSNSPTLDNLNLCNADISYFTDESCNVINICDTNNNSYRKSVNYDFPHIFKNELVNANSKYELETSDKRNNLNEKSQNISSLDILGELNVRNCYGVLSLILSNLADEDLRKASYVNKEWHDIVFNNKEAYTRRKSYIQEKKNIANGPRKENRFLSKSTNMGRNHKSVFVNVINSPTEEYKQPLYFTQSVGRFDSFIQEAKNLQSEEKLLKCPKCLYPSKVQSRSNCCCTRDLCKYIFCLKCLGPHLDNHSCSVPNLNATFPDIKVGSKQSKKNLRRL